METYRSSGASGRKADGVDSEGRESLKRRLFRRIDQDGDGALKQAEMRELAGLVGFEGSDDEWAREYEQLCLEHDLSPEGGIPEAVVLMLLDDQSDTGCFCTDKEIAGLLNQARYASDISAEVDIGVPTPPEPRKKSTKEEEVALAEIRAQLYEQGGKGQVWVDGWKERFARSFGTLRQFLERRPQLFRVIPEGTKKFSVALVDSEASKDNVGHGGTWVFFSGANFSTEESDLRSLFEEVGTVEEFKLRRLHDGRSRGLGNVRYSTEEEANWAVEALRDRDLDGRQLLVQPDIRADHGEEINGQLGDGKGSRFSSWNAGGKAAAGKAAGGGATWVPVGTHASASANAASSGGGKGSNDYGGSYKTGGGGGSTGVRGGGGGGSWSGSTHGGDGRTIFFAAASFDTPSSRLQRVFEEGGRVTQFWLFQLPDGRSKGMGVVQYQTGREAQDAIYMLNGKDVDGRELFVKDDDVGALQQEHQYQAAREYYGGSSKEADGWDWGGGGWGAKDNFKGTKGSGKGFGKGSAKGKGDWGGGGGFSDDSPWSSRVFFYGAPFSTSSDVIQRYFEEYGEIRSFKLMKLPDGRSRGMGICTFRDINAASEAMWYGIVIEGRPLHMQEDTSQYKEQEETWTDRTASRSNDHAWNERRPGRPAQEPRPNDHARDKEHKKLAEKTVSPQEKKRPAEKVMVPEASTEDPPRSDRVPTEFDPYMQKELYQRVNRQTLTQYIISVTKGDKQLAMLMNATQHACKVVSNAIEKAGPAGLYGLAGQENATGDDVKKLDLIADDIWIECLRRSGVCSVLVSEEQEQAIIIEDEAMRGPFCVAFDPLDGSSNIDCNVSVGSIFSVYRKKTGTETKPEVGDILRPGTDVIVAGYCMYGAATEMVISFGTGVQRFALDPALGEFLFVSDMVMDPNGGKKIFSCNEGNSLQWDPPILKYVEACKETGYAARYVGSMVSDVHRTLLYGGIFLYPADKKSTKGKLRVLYEGFPMAMITEQAGGVASTGMFQGNVGRILEVMPEHIHDRCPIIMGGARDVNEVLKMYE